MNIAESIVCPGFEALGSDEFDRQAFTSAKRAEKFIDRFCLSCPVMVECGERHAALSSIARNADGEPMRVVGVWGGKFHE